MTERAIAHQILSAVLLQHKSLDKVLTPGHAPFTKQLCYGVMRYYEELIVIVNSFLKKPLRRKEAEIEVALLMGCYEIFYGAKAAHAVVSAMVELVKNDYPWASKLVNAVLRNMLRQKDTLQTRVHAAHISARFAHPTWFIQALQHQYPEQWENILSANNQQAPMCLRIDLAKQSREDYLQELAAQHMDAFAHEIVDTAVVLAEPLRVNELPGFNDGRVSVQDAAAQLAATWLAPKNHERILDACCAPGGKTGHLLELAPQAQVLALDVSAERAKRVTENLKRLKLTADLQIADAADVAQWWDGKCFDKILLDAPCSGIGVIRRHPDIKYLRRESDFAALAQQQSDLLHKLWPTLKPAGQLLYATCSYWGSETQGVIEAFLKTQADAACIRQQVIFPGEQDMDGFFYALLQKAGR